MRWRHELWYCKAGFNCLFCQRIIKSDDDQVFTQIKIRSVYPGRRTRITSEEESVGGPVDVAVITKGDGFVWLKRKHYFSAELNPHYFERTKLE